MARYSQDDDDPDYDDIQSGRLDPNSLIPSAPAPVAASIQNFQTPGQASAPTTPAPQSPAAPAPPAPTTPEESAAAPVPPEVEPQVSVQAGQSASPAPSADADSATPPAAAPQSEAEMYRQYQKDEAGKLKYFKSQGGQTQTLPTGAEVPATDADGNQLYKPATINPLTTLDDGRAYSVHRDQYGNEKYRDILNEGTDGHDYHTDAQTGEQFVNLDGQKQVIGQDPLVPRINDAHAQAQSANNAVDGANIDIARAQHGVQGGGPLQAASLTDLRDQSKTLLTDLKPLQQQLKDLSSYTPDDGAASPADTAAKKQLQEQIQFKQDQQDKLQAEIDGRESIISDAQQRRDGSAQDRLNASMQVQMYRRVRQLGGMDSVQTDLETIANGGALAQNRAAALANVGLLNNEPQADGSTTLKVTSAGIPLLTEDTQKGIAKEPDSYAVSGLTSPSHVAAASDAVAPLLNSKNGDKTTTPIQNTAPKNYTVGQDGTPQFTPGNLSAGLMEAAKNGLVDPDKIKDLLPQAVAADKAMVEQQRIQQENPAAWKAFVSGAAKGSAFLAGSAPGAALGSEVGAGLGALGGPFAEVTVPLGIAAGSFVGGYIGGSLASKALEAAVNQLGQYSQTIKSFTDASQLHPNYDTAGNIVGFAAGLPKSVMQGAGKLLGAGATDTATVGQQLSEGLKAAKAAEAAGVGADATTSINLQAALKGVFSPQNLRQAVAQGTARGGEGLASTVENYAREAQLRAANGESVADIAKGIGLRVGAGSAGMVAIDTVLKQGAKALGISDQGQTVSGAVQSAIIGAFMSGHGIQFETKNSGQIADAVLRVKLHQDAGVPFDQPLEAQHLPPDFDIAQASQMRQPLTPKDMILAGAFEDAVRQKFTAGNRPSQDDALAMAKGATGTEVYRNGQRVLTNVKLGDEPESVDPPSANPEGSKGPGPAALTGIPNQDKTASETVSTRLDNPIPSSAETPTTDPQWQAVADRVTSGAKSQADGEAPTIAFRALRQIQAKGGEITPQTAEAVHAQVQQIMADPTADKQAALRDLVTARVNAKSGASPDNTGTSVVPARTETSIPGQTSPPAKQDTPTAAEPAKGERSPVVEQSQPSGGDVTTLPAGGQHDVAEFETSKGSRYTVDGLGHTTRTKNSPGAEQGETHPAMPAVFVRPQDQRNLMDEMRGGGRMVLGAEKPDGSFEQIRPDSTTDLRGQHVGVYVVSRADGSVRHAAEATTTPAVGLHPVEMKYEGDKKYLHVGNAITRVVKQGESRLASPELRSLGQRQSNQNTEKPPADNSAARPVPAVAGEGAEGQKATLEQSPSIASESHPAEATATQSTPPTKQKEISSSPESNTPTTFDKTAGEKIDRRRTAFSDESGHLGISRDQMPQVASQHRGAMANFLRPSHVPITREEVRPDSLKPSQSEFNHGKVEKAREVRAQKELMEENPRRILVSSDNHVLDGHHQWLAELKDHPDRPMPILRLGGTARDLLRQLAKFPSAGMEKAPDIDEPEVTHETAPIVAEQAATLAKTVYRANQGFLRRQGVRAANFNADTGGSGIAYLDGKLNINPEKLAAHLTVIRDNQKTHGIDATPEDAFHIALVEEGIHGLQDQIAKAGGFSGIAEHYSDANLPDEAMPSDWETQGRAVRSDWDQLAKWQKKAEFVRMIVQRQSHGQITEALYQRAEPILARLDELAKGAGVHDTLRSYIDGLTKAFSASQQPTKKKRSFDLPHAPTGAADVLDHIKDEGGIIANNGKPEFDDAPTLGGIYHQTVFGGTMKPDDMAATLHENHGVGDGSVGGMWKAVGDAVTTRQSVRAEKNRVATLERQKTNFDKAVDAPGKKNTEAVNARDLSIGQTVNVGGQQLKVIGIDPDENVTLEDHSKFGVQKIEDRRVLYVESVSPASEPSEPEQRESNSSLSSKNSSSDSTPRGDTRQPAESVSPADASGVSRENRASPPPEDAVSQNRGNQSTSQDFSLESVSGKQLDEERARTAQKAKIQEGQARRLSGKEIDTTGDLLDPLAADNPLFARPVSGSSTSNEAAKTDMAPKSGASKELLDSAREAFQGLFASEAKPVDQTETPAFKAWFGDSKVVDAQGKPLVVYHGSRSEFDVFSREKVQTNEALQEGAGFYFETSESGAQAYERDGGSTRAFYLSIKNPAPRELVDKWVRNIRNAQYEVKTRAEYQKIIRERAIQMRDALEGDGYDGYAPIGTSINGQWRGEIVVFSPEQIKSATDNNGDFDPSNPSILHAAPASEAQAGLPRERRAQFLDLADKMDAEGINTPERVAQFLDDLAPDGRARKYSQALWQFIGAADPSKAGAHDWPAIYSKMATAQAGSADEHTPSQAHPPLTTSDATDATLGGTSQQALERRQPASIQKESSADVATPPAEPQQAVAPSRGRTVESVERDLNDLLYRIGQDRARGVSNPDDRSRLSSLNQELTDLKAQQRDVADATPPSPAEVPPPSTVVGFKPNQNVIYRGRPAVIEQIDGEKATVRLKATSENGINLRASRVTGVSLSSLEAQPSADPKPARGKPRSESPAAPAPSDETPPDNAPVAERRDSSLEGTPATPESQSPEKSATDDAGAELSYNRRNRVRGGIKWDDIAAMNPTLRVKETNKANVYPKPDYAKMIEGDVPVLGAHIVKQVYDSLSAKPVLRTSGAVSDDVLKQYISGVHRVMDGVMKWAKDPAALAAWAQTQTSPRGPVSIISQMGADQAGRRGLLEAVYPGGDWKAHREELMAIGGNKVLGALQPSRDATLRATKEIAAGWPAKQEAWQKRGYKLASSSDAKVSSFQYGDGSSRYQVNLGTRGIKGFGEDKAAADAYVASLKPSLLLDKTGRIIGQYDTSDEAEDAAREMTKRASDGTKVSEKGISVEMARREGPAHRMEGENVPTARLQDAFGFKGVNFGNWMKGDAREAERQLHINHAYDSFMDLADVLGVPAKAMSLNGMLGLAIGAQGGGGGAAAHFVPGVNEINLTRTSGAGSLAHEWAHALDHYFAVQAGKSTVGEPFLSEHVGPRSDTTGGGIRPEIVDKFRQIVQAMNKRSETPDEVKQRIELGLKRAEGQAGRWLDSILADFKRADVPDSEAQPLAEKIRSLDLGDGKVAVGTTAFSPVVDNLRSLYKKQTGRTYSIDQMKGLQGNLDHAVHLKSAANQDKVHAPQMVKTNFSAEAAKLDGGKGGKPYYDTTLEKFARSFDAFVSDALEAKAQKNSYLSHAGRMNETTPQGDERTTITKAFQDLVDTVEHRPTEQGFALHAAPATPAEAATPERVEAARGALGQFADAIRGKLARLPHGQRIPAAFDAIDTMAHQRRTEVRASLAADFPDEMDLRAASHVTEAGGDLQTLLDHREMVRNSVDPELAAKFGPEYDHALKNVDRLHDKLANARNIEGREYTFVTKAGFSVKEKDRYLHHVFDPEQKVPSNLGPGRVDAADTARGTSSGTRGFMKKANFKTNAEAIQAGYEPMSTRLDDLMGRRAYNGRRLVYEQQFHNELAGMKAGDDQPLLGEMKESHSKLTSEGSVVSSGRLPGGYDSVQAGDNVLTVHKEYAPLLRSLYGTSMVRENPLTNALLQFAAFAKHGTVGIGDTYHLCRTAANAALGFGVTDYTRSKGLDYTPGDIDRMESEGVLSKEQADYARENRHIYNIGLRTGFNAGRVSDNLMSKLKENGLFNRIPILSPAVSKLNHFIFDEYQRNAARQCFVTAFRRLQKQNPDMPEMEAGAKASREINAFFGNLGNQGLFKSKTMQDVARLLLLAPQYAEGRFTTEARGFSQAAQIPADLARGRGLRVGNIAAAMGGTILAMAVGNQILNMFTKGHPTWENEDGHKFDAWIPGGPNNRGFYFSPLSIAAEYTHSMTRYLEGGESAIGAAAHILSNKLSPGARGAKDLLTGQDYAGRAFGSTVERIKAAAIDAAPSPLPLSGVLQKDPKAPLGYSVNHHAGSLERQALSMFGAKVDAAQSARSKVFQLAQPFRQNKEAGTTPGAYSNLRQLLDSEEYGAARQEIQRLQADGHSPEHIEESFGYRKDGSVRPELFTGSHDSEQRMLRSLTPAQRKTYVEAQHDHMVLAQRLKRAEVLAAHTS